MNPFRWSSFLVQIIHYQCTEWYEKLHNLLFMDGLQGTTFIRANTNFAAYTIQS